MIPNRGPHDCGGRGFVELIIRSNCLDMTSSFLDTRKNISSFALKRLEDGPPPSTERSPSTRPW